MASQKLQLYWDHYTPQITQKLNNENLKLEETIFIKVMGDNKSKLNKNKK